MADGVEEKKRLIIRKPRVYHDNVDYSKMNQTELSQHAQFNDIPGACLGTPREVLLWAIKNMRPVGENPIDAIRDRYSKFLKKNWSVVGSQCPYPFERCPDCFKSPDVQVIHCYLPDKLKGFVK